MKACENLTEKLAMLRIKIEYLNYNENIQNSFPRIITCKLYEKNSIFNLELFCSNIVADIFDDICYDSNGKYISICIGQWHNMRTGEYLPLEEILDLDEFQIYEYEYVEAIIKIYTNKKYKLYYHNYMDRNIKISLIPQELVNFDCRDCKEKLFDYKS